MLTKKDKKKRYNKKTRSLTGHEFGMGTKSLEVAKDAFSGSNLGGSLSSVVGGIGGIVEAGMANAQIADTTEQEQEREARENWQSSANSNTDLLAEMASDVSIGNTNWKSIRGVTPGQMVGNTFKGIASGAAAGAKVGGPWGAVAGAVVGLGSSIAGIFAGNSKAKKKAAELNEAANKANLAKAQTLTAKAGALDQAADQRALAAYAAYGGGINAPKFSDYPSEITEFNTGGSHEENPYDGIPQGIAPDGLPNLVEEGEVKYDNYIFSDRLMLNKNDKKKYKFLKGKTYADAAKSIKRELGIDERPNDLIAKTDLGEQLNLLSTLQEEERAKRGLRGENRMMYPDGGPLSSSRYEEDDYPISYFPSPLLLDNISKDNSAIAPLLKFDYKKTFGANPEDGINKGLKSTELDLSTNRPSYTPKKSSTTNTGSWRSSLLQSMPAVGSAIGLFSNLLDKPKYEHTRPLTETEKSISPVTFTPNLQRVQYKPTDLSPLTNKVMAQSAATRAAIAQQNATNPHTATIGLLVNDYNTNNQLGDIYIKGAAQDDEKKMKAISANNQVALAEAEGIMKAASTNAALQDKALSRQAEKDIYAARLNIAEDQAWDTANSANMTSLFDNLGTIGREEKEFALAAIKALGEGKMTPEQLAIYAKQFPGLGKYLGYKGAYGGKLRKKKGYTI